MVLIEWRKEFRTGIKGIDNEHEKLIKQINSIYALIDNKADKQLIIDSLGDIYGSISAHFALEEQTMQKLDYPHYSEHKADHERLLDDIGDIAEDVEDSVRLDESELKEKLTDWFQVHFSTHDARFHKQAYLMSDHLGEESTIKSLMKKAKKRLLSRARRQT